MLFTLWLRLGLFQQCTIAFPFIPVPVIPTIRTLHRRRRGQNTRILLPRQGADPLQQQLERVAHRVGARVGVLRPRVAAATAAHAFFEPRGRAAGGAERAQKGQRCGEARAVGGVEEAVRPVALHEVVLGGVDACLQGMGGEAHLGDIVGGLR